MVVGASESVEVSIAVEDDDEEGSGIGEDSFFTRTTRRAAFLDDLVDYMRHTVMEIPQNKFKSCFSHLDHLTRKT